MQEYMTKYADLLAELSEDSELEQDLKKNTKMMFSNKKR
jgi:hypothetical protein